MVAFAHAQFEMLKPETAGFMVALRERCTAVANEYAVKFFDDIVEVGGCVAVLSFGFEKQIDYPAFGLRLRDSLRGMAATFGAALKALRLRVDETAPYDETKPNGALQMQFAGSIPPD